MKIKICKPVSLLEVKSRIVSVAILLVVAFVSSGHAQEVAAITIPVNSPAFVFSPGNWVADEDGGVKSYRQTWNPGAYFRVTWESGTKVAPTLLLDTSTHGEPFGAPKLAYCLDGIWSGDVPCAQEIRLEGSRPSGRHRLTVFLKSSAQMNRWGSKGVSGANVLRVTGLRIDGDGKPVSEVVRTKWALIVGDSITEGVGAYELECYSHLVGEALLTQGYEYGISACGWSGWLNKGDNPPGDVPGYYVVTNSTDGAGGQYLDTESRWNKIDANHSLLDTNGHITATGAVEQEPLVILINYGTNDALWKQNASDVQASIRQCLLALRKAAPDAHIFILIPFGQYKAAELYQAVAEVKKARLHEQRLTVIDLGPDVARALTVKIGYWGGLHPNPRAHATFATKILAQMLAALNNAADD